MRPHVKCGVSTRTSLQRSTAADSFATAEVVKAIPGDSSSIDISVPTLRCPLVLEPGGSECPPGVASTIIVILHDSIYCTGVDINLNIAKRMLSLKPKSGIDFQLHGCNF